jgi:hypothetical protein
MEAVVRLAPLALVALLLGAATAAAQGGPVAAPASAVRTATAARIDGPLTEAAWARSIPITSFVQREPAEGAAPTFRTEARVAYDDNALYVSVRAFDGEADRIQSYLTRRDVDSPSDWVEVYIDSYHDRRTAYHFAVNPAGVKRDGYMFNDDNYDSSWDAVWDVTTARDADGWRAEFRIPYSQLRFSRGGDGRLGFAVGRRIARRNEMSTWPLIARSGNGFVSQFGDLEEVVIPRATRRLELVPYAVGQVTTSPRQEGNPLHRTRDGDASVGVDLKYAITPALSLTATVNPDFGQVEADPAVVNLSGFETFFQERRPFFIEGSGNYQVGCGGGCDLFYSRRIGRSPRGAPALGDGEFSRQPAQSTILGAAKLTGRIGAFAVGTLAALSQEEQAEIALGSLRRREAVEPQSFYSVSRARREFSDRSSVGAILTTTTRQRVDALSFLPDTATTGGVDYDWRMGDKFALQGFLMGSTVRGTPEAIDLLQRSPVHSYQRPDAGHVAIDPLARSMSGHSGMVNFAKISGERVRLGANFSYKSTGFDLNDIGFLRRADEMGHSAFFNMRWESPGKYIRQKQFTVDTFRTQNLDGDRLGMGAGASTDWTFQNQWGTGGWSNLFPRVFDDRLTRGGPGGYVNGGFNAFHYFNSNDRLPVSFHWFTFFSRNTDGSRTLNMGPTIQLRPTSALSAEIGVSVDRNRSAAQWVGETETADRTHFVFGRLEQTTSAITTRVNYTVTPNLSLQVYAQPFVSAGAYSGFKELIDGRAARFDDRYAPFAYAENPDFRVLSFRTTNVMRWEFRPGSTLFVVWQQGREGFASNGSFQFGRHYRDVFATPSSNTLLVKLAYWVNR